MRGITTRWAQTSSGARSLHLHTARRDYRRRVWSSLPELIMSSVSMSQDTFPPSHTHNFPTAFWRTGARARARNRGDDRGTGAGTMRSLVSVWVHGAGTSPGSVGGLSLHRTPKITRVRHSPHERQAPLCVPALLDYSLSWPGFKMHLFGFAARGMRLPGCRLQAASAREAARRRGKEAREGGVGERSVKAVAGISSPARQLITRRLPKNILDHRAAAAAAQTPPSRAERTRMCYQTHRISRSSECAR